jgi:dihydrolipoamide dehydrogenase
MTDIQCDLAVIGSGPGGYVAAIRASQLGMKTAIVERDALGGVCLNWGCIPTKALLRSAEVYRTMQRAADFGLKAEKVGFDIDAAVKRSRAVAARMEKGVAFLMKKNKIDVVKGEGRLEKPAGGSAAPSVSVRAEGGETRISAQHVILATGARARTIPGAGLAPDGECVWTATEAMLPDVMPKSLLVVGSGAIGVEFASFYRVFGAEVSVVEMAPRILPAEDEEISALAEREFKKQGMKILTSATVEKLEKGGGAATATVKTADGKIETIAAERVILAMGIVGNTDHLGLEPLGVHIENGHVAVNEWLETGAPRLYAIGDVAGPPWLAHKASHEGVVCVEKIAGVKDVRPLDASLVPGCTYCLPQIASVGLTEAKAREEGRKVRIGRFPFSANGKAIAMSEPEGMVKTVFDDDTGEFLGAHMIGADVTELIHGFGIARSLEAVEADLIHAIFPHPTLSEMMHESVLGAWGRALHL